MSSRSTVMRVLVPLALLAMASPAGAVILARSADRNLAAPAGSVAEVPWSLTGQYNAFLGTPIGPRHFITARHVGGGVGTVLAFRGVGYTAVGEAGIGNTDLKVVAVDGTFPAWAPLWDEAVDGSEVGKPLVVLGRGYARGSAFYGPGDPGIVSTGPSGTIGRPMVLTAAPPTGPAPTPVPSHKGWGWGVYDQLQSWGDNVVDTVVPDERYGDLLAFDFDGGRGATPNESMLAGGDSGGPVFIRSGGVWKLAGVNLGIDGPFATRPDGPYFFGAITDAGGLYVGSPAENDYVLDLRADVPASSYSSRIAGSVGTIRGIVGPGSVATVPEPVAMAMVTGLVLLSLRPPPLSSATPRVCSAPVGRRPVRPGTRAITGAEGKSVGSHPSRGRANPTRTRRCDGS